MKSLRIALAAAVVAVFAVVAPSPAQAYPGVTVVVSNIVKIGGQDAKVTASTSPAVDCDWVVKFGDQTRTGSGSSISVVFQTQVTDQVRTGIVTATCTYDDGATPTASGGGSGAGLGTSFVTATQTATGQGTITCLPRGGGGNGDGGGGGGILPNTGGERLAWLIIGALLVLVGGGVVVASRRREADLT